MKSFIKKLLFRRTAYLVFLILSHFILQPLCSEDEEQQPETAAESDLSLPESWQDIVAFVKYMQSKKKPLFYCEPLTNTFYYYKDKTNFYSESRYNFEFALAYTSLYQSGTIGIPPTDVFGDDYELWAYLSLTRPNSNHPSLIAIKAEGRNKFTSIPPRLLFLNIGSLWGTTTVHSQQPFNLIQLWWEYHLIKDITGIRAGKMDITDFIDIYNYISPDYGFISEGLSSNLTIPFPDNGLTFQIATKARKDTYFQAVIADANGDRRTLAVDSFFEEEEYFSAIEFGYVPKFCFGQGKYHLTVWHKDHQKKENIPSARGFTLSLEQTVGEHFHPFIRYGYGEGKVAPTTQMVAAGFGIKKPFNRKDDLFGFGFVWGKPHDNKLRDQYMVESFYRLQLFPHVQISPDIQLYIHPSYSPKETRVGVISIRLRIDG